MKPGLIGDLFAGGGGASVGRVSDVSAFGAVQVRASNVGEVRRIEEYSGHTDVRCPRRPEYSRPVTTAHPHPAEVRAWALENGDNPRLRIALCGYEGEHEMPDTWECVSWKAVGGYAAAAGNHENAHRERIWFSPRCELVERQGDLFATSGRATA